MAFLCTVILSFGLFLNEILKAEPRSVAVKSKSLYKIPLPNFIVLRPFQSVIISFPSPLLKT